jgi:hypothetical protein
LSLWTITWFEPCGNATFKRLNDFDMNTLEWKKKLKFGEKFKDMNNCMLNVSSNIPDGYEYLEFLTPQWQLMNFAAERLNFSYKIIRDIYSSDIWISDGSYGVCDL